MEEDKPPSARCGTGIPGLDAITAGGLPRGALYLVEGDPGVGKTTLALQFLLEGVRSGERCLYVTLSETQAELAEVANSHGWSLEGIEIVALSAVEQALSGKSRSTFFHPADVELGALVGLIEGAVGSVEPSRLAIDSLSEMRLLAQTPLRYRRQILDFKQRFAAGGRTALLLDDRSASARDAHVESIVHGIVSLTAAPLRYGVFRRFLSVTKMRAVEFREGTHDYVIRRGGLHVFPRLVAADHQGTFPRTVCSSGNAELDALLGGGLHAGTSNLLMGPAGSGKSTIAAMFAHAAASRGEGVRYYAFDETERTLLDRLREMRLDFAPHMRAGRLAVRQIDPAQVSPGELADDIVRGIEREGVRVVVLDSLNGYVTAMPADEFLYLHLHELVTVLNQRGVMTLIILAQHGLVGPTGAPVDVSYIADSVVLTRFFEAGGAVKKAISVIKKRSGPHEATIRELEMTPRGIKVGPAITRFEGVLSGIPRYLGDTVAR